MTSIKALNERSTFLGNVSKSNDKAIADHCVLIADHINEHGDVTAADFLCKCLPGGLRVNLIREWFLTYAGCSWNAEKKQFGKRKAGTFTYDRSKAIENPWFNLRPEAPFKPFDLEKFLKSAITKAKAALEDTAHEKDHSVNKEMLRQLEALLVDKPAHFVEEATLEVAGWTEVEGGAMPNGHEAVIPAVEAASVH